MSADRPVSHVRQSDERFRLLVESVTDYAIYTMGPNGTVESWNPGAQKLKGYTEAEILGASYEKFFTPEDRAAGKPGRLLRKARELGHIQDEGWRVRKDGTRFWALAVLTAIHDHDGNFVGYGKVTRDLTEHKVAEEQRRQLELLIKSVSDYAILMLDTEGRITSWNRGAERLKGYAEDEVLGKSHQIFYTPEDIAAGRPRELLAQARRDGHAEHEGWRVRKDGTRFWADVVITAIRDESGELIGFGKVTRDLTERKQVEELRAQTAQLQATNRLKTEFLAKMSHELRTPLNSIIGYTDLVLTDDTLALNDTAKENLHTVLRNGVHLLSLINEVLDLSKLEAGQATVNPSRFAPRIAAHVALDVVRPEAAAKGLAVELHVDPEVGEVVQDEMKLGQILINLVGNAVKFTEQGRVDVTIAPAGPERFAIAVKDTGIGIAPEHHELIFQEFRQVDAGTNRKRGGTGLGLSISRRLAELMGGNVTVESEPGVGSTFTVELPRVLPAGREAAA